MWTLTLQVAAVEYNQGSILEATWKQRNTCCLSSVQGSGEGDERGEDDGAPELGEHDPGVEGGAGGLEGQEDGGGGDGQQVLQPA